MKCSALISVLALTGAVTASPAFVSQHENDFKSLKSKEGNNIVDRLRSDERFSRFVEVLEKERGLRDELENGDRQATVFAPTNEAFKHAEDQWALNKDEQTPDIKDVLRYHIAKDADISGDCLHAGALLPSSLRLDSLNDRHQRMRVFRFAGEIWLNMQARIVEKDIEANNGRIHAINRVILPPMNVLESIGQVPTRFSMSIAAFETTGLCKDVTKEKGVTLFVPSNQAWENLGFDNLRYLFSCAGQKTSAGGGSDWDSVFDSEKGERVTCRGRKDLKKIMEQHVGTELYYTTDIMQQRTVQIKTLGNEQIKVCARSTRNGGERDDDEDERRRRRSDRGRKNDDDQHKDVRQYNFVVNDGQARISFTDGLACNGAIQAVDNVLIPKNVKLPHDMGKMY